MSKRDGEESINTPSTLTGVHLIAGVAALPAPVRKILSVIVAAQRPVKRGEIIVATGLLPRTAERYLQQLAGTKLLTRTSSGYIPAAESVTRGRRCDREFASSDSQSVERPHRLLNSSPNQLDRRSIRHERERPGTTPAEASPITRDVYVELLAIVQVTQEVRDEVAKSNRKASWRLRKASSLPEDDPLRKYLLTSTPQPDPRRRRHLETLAYDALFFLLRPNHWQSQRRAQWRCYVSAIPDFERLVRDSTPNAILTYEERVGITAYSKLPEEKHPLSESDVETLMAFEGKEKTVGQIAEALGLTDEATRQRLSRMVVRGILRRVCRGVFAPMIEESGNCS